jgi:CheY-like chemotaxis protein
MKILLVDDDSDDRSLFCEAVKQIDAAIECDEAEDGAIALEKLGRVEVQPDIIFLDVNMPVLNGRDCLLRIKSDEKLKHIPVVVCTTSASEKEAESFKYSGADFITKPNRFHLLVKMIGCYVIPLQQQVQLVKRMNPC